MAANTETEPDDDSPGPGLVQNWAGRQDL